MNISINYYEVGNCQLHAKVADGQYIGAHVVAIGVMEFDPENKPECNSLDWYTVNDPEGYAEPNMPVKKEVVESFEWSE